MPFFDATLTADALIGKFQAFGASCRRKHEEWPAATDTVTIVSLDSEMQDLYDFLVSPKFKERVDTGNWNEFLLRYKSISAAFTAANSPHKGSFISKVQSTFTKADADSIEFNKQLKAVLERILKLVEQILSAVSTHDEEERIDSLHTAMEEEEAHHANAG
ncbi:hypothetical protein EXIGLDRAFT_148294 [Exidia glandulosa HHB12029]|uniref:Uncharacterized protein n=1 Tax=Exidia glandulosa HHB12029 TaxID=1314781 RepID=A0A166A810_EXIGL|nr:hypothetical protein EXIGLDRAFT_148294 [Exidia glandulosa HHB12029]